MELDEAQANTSEIDNITVTDLDAPAQRQNSLDGQSQATFHSSVDYSIEQRSKTGMEEEQDIPLVSELNKNVNFVRETVTIEDIENQFYLLWKDWEKSVRHARFTFESLSLMHHIYQLIKIEDSLSQYEKIKLYYDLDEINSAYPSAMEEYVWIERAVSIYNNLAIKWGIVDVNRYSYRIEKSTNKDHLARLEAQNLRRDIFTMETLWFAHSARYPPLNMILSKKLIFIAVELQRQILNLTKFIVKQNEQVKFDKYPEIHTYLSVNAKARTKLEIGQDYHVIRKKSGASKKEVIPAETRIIHMPGRTAEQKRLRMKKQREIGFHLFEFAPAFWRCWEKSYHTANYRLKEMLTDFEIIYREFENAFLKDYAYLGTFLKEERRMAVVEEKVEDEEDYTLDEDRYHAMMDAEMEEVKDISRSYSQEASLSLHKQKSSNTQKTPFSSSFEESLNTFMKIST